MRSANLTRPIKAGDTVAVLSLGASGLPYFEGRATVVEQCREPHLFRVQFTGERVLRTRFVAPNWQSDPESSLAILVAFWRTSQLPEFEDFFPDDHSSLGETSP
jgi:hypothetical protein